MGGIFIEERVLLSDAKFIYSKDKLVYQEVMDDFKNAEEIIVKDSIKL